MDGNGNVGFWCSWPVIIIALIFFWPVGLFLIVWRASKDRRTAMGAGKLIGILGIISYVFAALVLVACFGDGFDGDTVGVMIFFVLAAFALRYVAKRIQKNAENVKEYLAVIVNGNERQLDAIASSTGKSYDEVHGDIKQLIEKGYLKNAYIDEEARAIVLPEATPAQPNVESIATPQQHDAKIVACPCCGANNTVYGAVGECEYCGSPLK